MASSDLVSALRTRRYTLQLCSYSQELFLAYLMEHKFMVVFGQRFSYFLLNTNTFIVIFGGSD